MQPPYHRQIGAREKFRLVVGLPILYRSWSSARRIEIVSGGGSYPSGRSLECATHLRDLRKDRTGLG